MSLELSQGYPANPRQRNTRIARLDGKRFPVGNGVELSAVHFA